VRTEINVNADILTWAIARAGFDLHEFTDKLPNVQKRIEGEKNQQSSSYKIFPKKYIFLSDIFFYLLHQKRIYQFPFTELKVQKQPLSTLTYMTQS
jgi:hypothetical protein